MWITFLYVVVGLVALATWVIGGSWLVLFIGKRRDEEKRLAQAHDAILINGDLWVLQGNKNVVEKRLQWLMPRLCEGCRMNYQITNLLQLMYVARQTFGLYTNSETTCLLMTKVVNVVRGQNNWEVSEFAKLHAAVQNIDPFAWSPDWWNRFEKAWSEQHFTQSHMPAFTDAMRKLWIEIKPLFPQLKFEREDIWQKMVTKYVGDGCLEAVSDLYGGEDLIPRDQLERMKHVLRGDTNSYHVEVRMRILVLLKDWDGLRSFAKDLPQGEVRSKTMDILLEAGQVSLDKPATTTERTPANQD